tara:strand:+ start:321 stop:875 length:555 start_codon:yes stop_codon:yes gene_type:complete
MGRKKIYTQEEQDEKRRVYQRKYHKKYRSSPEAKERRHLTTQKWRAKNKEKLNLQKSIHKKRLRKNDSIHFVGEDLRKSAKKRGLEAPLTNTEYREWFKSQKQVCSYCSSDLTTINNYLKKIGIQRSFRRLSVDRKNSDKGYVLDNIILACYLCNISKQAIFSHSDFVEIAQKYIVPKIAKVNK